MLISLKWRRYKLFVLIPCPAHSVLCGQMSVHGMGWSFLDCTMQWGVCLQRGRMAKSNERNQGGKELQLSSLVPHEM